jgi:membrane protein
MNSRAGVEIWKHLNPWTLLLRTWRAFQDNQLHARCAQFAYYSILGLTPLLIVTISGIALLPLSGTMEIVLEMLQRALPADAYQLIFRQIQSIETATSPKLLLLNLAIFAFAGARLFVTVSEGLNSAFGLPPRYRRVRMFGISSLMPLVYALLLLLALAFMVLLPAAIGWLIHLLEIQRLESFLLQAARWVVVLGFALLFTATIYCVVPAQRLPWRLFTPGNVFAVFGWVMASQGFRLYVDNFANYDVTYGTLGGVIVLLLWLYLTGAFLFIGGQINGVIFGYTDKRQSVPLTGKDEAGE